MNNALTKLPPQWHAEAACLLNENFGKIHTAFQDATKRAVWMGMFLNHIKAKGKEDCSIPHGQFGGWLEKNVPEIPWRTANTYQKLADGVCEKGKFEIRQFSEFAQSGVLPPKIEKMIEGQTQQQLFLEFKNVDGDGNPRKPGQLPGSKGLSKKMRLEAKFADNKVRMEALAVNVPQVALWLKRHCNALGFPQLDAKLREQMRAAIEDAHLYFKSLEKDGGVR